MHFWGFLRHQAQLAEAVQPGDCPLRHPAKHTQAAAVFRPPLGELRLHPTLAQFLAMRLRVIRPIRVQLLRTTLRLTVLVLRPATVHQRQQFLDLRNVGGRDVAGQRDAIGINENVLLDARSSAICGVFAAALHALEGAGEGAIDGRPRPIDEVGIVQTCEQDVVEARPDTGLVPVAKATPAGHAAATAHLGGQVFPADAGLEDEEDAGQCLAVLDPFTSRIAEASRLVWRNQGLQHVPEFIGNQWLGHSSTSRGKRAIQERYLRRTCHWPHFVSGSYEPAVFEDEVKEYLTGHGFNVFQNVKEKGSKTGKKYNLSFRVPTRERSFWISAISPKSSSGIQSKINYNFRMWYDLNGGMTKDKKVNLLNDELIYFKDEDVKILEEVFYHLSLDEVPRSHCRITEQFSYCL